MTALGVLRRNRALGVVLGLVALGVLALVLVGPRSADPTDPLEPGNPNPEGAQALERVLADHGVRVTIAHGQSELAAARVDHDTTVFVTSTGQLSTHTSRRLAALAADAGSLVLADAPTVAVKSLGLGVRGAFVPVEHPVGAACDDPLLADLNLDVPETVGHHVRTGSGLQETCFPVTFHHSTYGLVTRVDRRPSTYLVGAAELFSNGRITSADDAAVALRLLGQHAHLVWYVADAADVPPGDAGPLSAVLPPWLGQAVILVCLAVLALVLWRGRRLGPLVVEPLPVVVKAIESTTSRGRLYSRARDRDHVAWTLREATAVRLAEQLRLPRHTGVDTLVLAVAARLGRRQDEIGDLLGPRPVPDDAALTLLAQRLTELEREVRQP